MVGYHRGAASRGLVLGTLAIGLTMAVIDTFVDAVLLMAALSLLVASYAARRRGRDRLLYRDRTTTAADRRTGSDAGADDAAAPREHPGSPVCEPPVRARGRQELKLDRQEGSGAVELSRREQEILAQIEDEFTAEEKALAADLEAERARRLRHSPAARTGLGLVVLLALGLLAVILVGVLLELGPIGLFLVTAAVIIPWFAFAYTSLGRSAPDK